jgi:hypothetical protein
MGGLIALLLLLFFGAIFVGGFGLLFWLMGKGVQSVADNRQANRQAEYARRNPNDPNQAP